MLSNDAMALCSICLFSGIIIGLLMSCTQIIFNKINKFAGEVYVDVAKGESEAYIDEVLKIFEHEEKKRQVFVRIVPGYIYTKKEGVQFYKDSVIRVSKFIVPFIGGTNSRKVTETLDYLKEKVERSGLSCIANGVY